MRTPIFVLSLLLWQSSVDTILERYIRIVGGREALSRITTRVTKGEIVTAAGRIPWEAYQKAPDKCLIRIETPDGLSVNAYDGRVGWSRTPAGEIRDMDAVQAGMMRRDNFLAREASLPAIYKALRLRGDSIVEADVDGATPEILFFDPQTGLLQRVDIIVQGASIRTDFDDYRKVDGILLPFTIRRSRPGFSWSYQVKEIVHNGRLEDTFFQKPR